MEGSGLDELAAEDAQAAENVADFGAEAFVDEPADHFVAEAVHGAVGLAQFALGGAAFADDHVGLVAMEEIEEGGNGVGGVGGIAIDHDVDVGLDGGEHVLDDAALAAAGGEDDLCPGLGGNLGGAICAGIIENPNLGVGKDAAEIPDDIGDGFFLVVARDEHGDSGRAGGRGHENEKLPHYADFPAPWLSFGCGGK